MSEIRAMTPDDLKRIVELENASFSAPWSRQSFEMELSGNPYSHPVVYEENGTILGYAIVWIMFEQASLASIAVDPAVRQKRIGWQLLEHVIGLAQTEGAELFSLEVRPSNQAARAMYEKRGFVPLHTSKNYYSDGEDAIVMGLGI